MENSNKLAEELSKNAEILEFIVGEISHIDFDKIINHFSEKEKIDCIVTLLNNGNPKSEDFFPTPLDKIEEVSRYFGMQWLASASLRHCNEMPPHLYYCTDFRNWFICYNQPLKQYKAFPFSDVRFLM